MAGDQPRKKPFSFSAKRLDEKLSPTEDVLKLQALLARYGDLKHADMPGKYDRTTRDAVSQLQAFYRISPEQDGVGDEQTVALLSRPRCGVADGPPMERTATCGTADPWVRIQGNTTPRALA